MRAVSFLFIFFCLFSNGYSQDEKANLETLHRKLRSVKYADLGINETAMKALISRGTSESLDILAIKLFFFEDLKLMGTIITEEDREIVYSNCNSVTEIVNVNWQIGSFKSDFGAIGSHSMTIEFSFADKTRYRFNFPINVSGSTQMNNAIRRSLRKNIGEFYVKGEPLKIDFKRGEVIYTEDDLAKYFDNQDNKLKIEGVYKLIKGNGSIEKLAIAQKNGKIYFLNIKNKYFVDDWNYGEIRGIIEPTLARTIFTGTYLLIDKQEQQITLTVKEDNIIEITDSSGLDPLTFIKIK